MERNADNSFGAGNISDSTAGFGGTSGSQAGSQGSAGSSDASFGSSGSAGDRLSDTASTVRERAAGLKGTLADALESGAERLRRQGAGGGQIAGASATGGSVGMTSGDNSLAETSNQLAGGLQASADWLRDADIDGLKAGLERQVKEHPGRTLAVAVGLGYLLGKALRK